MGRFLSVSRGLSAAAVLLAAGCGEGPITNDSVVSTRTLDSLVRSSSDARLPAEMRTTLTRARDLIAQGERPAEESLSVANLNTWTELTLERRRVADSVAAALAAAEKRAAEAAASAAATAERNRLARYSTYARFIATEADAVLRLMNGMNLQGRELGPAVASTAFRMTNMADNFAARDAPSDLAEVHRQMASELREMSAAMTRAGNLLNITCEQAQRAGVPCADARVAATGRSITELERAQSRVLSYGMARLRATRMLKERGVDVPDP